MRRNDLIRCIGALLMAEPWFQWLPGMADCDYRRVIIPVNGGDQLRVLHLGEEDLVEPAWMSPPSVCDLTTWACMVGLSSGKMLSDDALMGCFAEIEAIENPDFSTVKRMAADRLGISLSNVATAHRAVNAWGSPHE